MWKTVDQQICLFKSSVDLKTSIAFTHHNFSLLFSFKNLLIPLVSVAKSSQYAHQYPQAYPQQQYYSNDYDYGHYDAGHYDAGHYDAGHYDAGHYY